MRKEGEILPTEKKIDEMVKEAQHLTDHLIDFIDFATGKEFMNSEDLEPHVFCEALYDLRYGRIIEVQHELKVLGRFMNKFFELYPFTKWGENWDFSKDEVEDPNK